MYQGLKLTMAHTKDFQYDPYAKFKRALQEDEEAFREQEREKERKRREFIEKMR